MNNFKEECFYNINGTFSCYEKNIDSFANTKKTCPISILKKHPECKQSKCPPRPTCKECDECEECEKCAPLPPPCKACECEKCAPLPPPCKACECQKCAPLPPPCKACDPNMNIQLAGQLAEMPKPQKTRKTQWILQANVPSPSEFIFDNTTTYSNIIDGQIRINGITSFIENTYTRLTILYLELDPHNFTEFMNPWLQDPWLKESATRFLSDNKDKIINSIEYQIFLKDKNKEIQLHKRLRLNNKQVGQIPIQIDIDPNTEYSYFMRIYINPPEILVLGEDALKKIMKFVDKYIIGVKMALLGEAYL